MLYRLAATRRPERDQQNWQCTLRRGETTHAKEYDVLTVVKTLIHISVSEHSGCAMMRIIQQRVSRVQSPGTLDRETRGRATDGTTADFSQDGPGPLPPRAAQSQPRHGCHAVALAAPSPSSTLGGGSGAAEAGRYPPS